MLNLKVLYHFTNNICKTVIKPLDLYTVLNTTKIAVLWLGWGWHIYTPI